MIKVRTAEELYISQPALTKRLRVIEKELDVIIAERTSQGLQFTAAGRCGSAIPAAS